MKMKKIIKDKCDKCGKEFEKNRFDYTHGYIYCKECMEIEKKKSL